ncbi:MAG: cation transporter [Pseudomonadota bacterium]
MTSPLFSPTPAQKSQESAVLWAIIMDAVLWLPMFVAGIFSGSLTVISELARILLLLSIEIVSYVILRRAHRGKLQDFDFGTGKLERGINLLVALGLFIVCLFIFYAIVSRGDGVPLSMPALFLSAISAYLNTLENFYFTLALARSNKTDSSVIIASQIKSRLAKTVATAIVLGVLVFALWLPDPKAARMVDVAGSIFVICFMLVIAIGLCRESLPEILDRTIPEPEQYQILQVLSAHFDRYDGFLGYRTRRSGKDLFILLNLCFLPETTLARIEARLLPLRRALESEIPGANVTIIPEIFQKPEAVAANREKLLGINSPR